jgi:hypothetical protein
MEASGRPVPWFTSRNRSSIFAKASRRVGRSATVPMVSARWMRPTVPLSSNASSRQRITHTFRRFPSFDKVPV